MRRYVFCQHDEADRVWKPPAGKAAGSHYLDDIMKEGEKFLSQEEYTYIRAVGMRAEKEMAAKCMDIIRGLCTVVIGYILHIITEHLLVNIFK